MPAETPTNNYELKEDVSFGDDILSKILDRMKYKKSGKGNIELNDKERNQIKTDVIEFETAYRKAIQEYKNAKEKYDYECKKTKSISQEIETAFQEAVQKHQDVKQKYNKFRGKLLRLYNGLKTSTNDKDIDLCNLIWETYAAMGSGRLRNEFNTSTDKNKYEKEHNKYKKAFDERATEEETITGTTAMELDLLIEGINVTTYQGNALLFDGEMSMPEQKVLKGKEQKKIEVGPYTQQLFTFIGYTGIPNDTVALETKLDTLSGICDFSQFNTDFISGIYDEIHDKDDKISAPARTLQNALVKWFKKQAKKELKPPHDSLAHLVLMIGDFSTSQALLNFRSKADQLVYNFCNTQIPPLPFPHLRNGFTIENQKPEVLAIIVKVATGNLKDEEKDILDPDKIHQTLQNTLLSQLPPPTANPNFVQKSKMDNNIQMLLYKEQQDARFGDMYSFLLDWAQQVNIDTTKMQQQIFRDIVNANNDIGNCNSLLTTLFPGGLLQISSKELLGKVVNDDEKKATEKKKLLERCKLYALDRLLLCYEAYTGHQLCNDPTFPDEYKNPPINGWLSMNEKTIQEDQTSYIAVLQESQKYQEKQMVLDRDKLNAESKQQGCSAEFQKRMNSSSLDTLNDFTQAMRSDAENFEKKPEDPSNSENMTQWILLLSGGAPFFTMTIDPRLKKLLDTNEAMISRYQKFLTLTDNSTYKKSIQAYQQMQSMTNGIFAGNKNFGAIKSICPLLATEMETRVLQDASKQVEHSQWIKHHPLLGGLGSFGRGLWNGSGGTLGDIFLSANMIKNNLITIHNESKQYLNHQFLLSYMESKVHTNQYKQDGAAFEIGNATGSVVLSLLISSVTGALGGKLLSAGMREFLSGVIMKIPQYSKSILKQVQSKGLKVDFAQAYLYTTVSMVAGGLVSKLNKTTFASLGGGSTLRETITGFLLMNKTTGFKIALRQGLQALMKHDALSEGVEEVSDESFEGLIDWMTAKATENVNYFDGISADQLLKTFAYTMIGMKNVKMGKQGFQGIANIPRYVTDMQTHFANNPSKIKAFPDKLQNTLLAQEQSEIVMRYDQKLQEYLQQKYGESRGDEYQAQKDKTGALAEKELGRTLTTVEKQVIWEAHVIGFGDIGKDGKTTIGFDYDEYSPEHIRKKARHLAILDDNSLPPKPNKLSAEDRAILIKKHVCGVWKFINKMKKNFSGPERKDPVILPPEVRFALENKGAQLGSKEISELQSASFGDLGYYLAMKYFDSNPEIQKEIMNIYLSGESKTKIFKAIEGYLNKYPDLAPINGSKAAQVSRQGFEYFPRKTTEIFDRCRHEGRTPVVMLYAGLLMMDTITQQMQQMQEGDTVLFLDPHKQDGYSGWQLKKIDGKVTRQELQPPIFTPASKIMLIDDVISSGSSLMAMRERLIQAFTLQDVSVDAVVKLKDIADTSETKPAVETSKNPDSHLCQEAMKKCFPDNEIIVTRNAILDPAKAIFGDAIDTNSVTITHNYINNNNNPNQGVFNVKINRGTSLINYSIIVDNGKSSITLHDINVTKADFPGGEKAIAFLDACVDNSQLLGLSNVSGYMVIGEDVDALGNVTREYNGAYTWGVMGFYFANEGESPIKNKITKDRGVSSLIELMKQKKGDKVSIEGQEMTLDTDGKTYRRQHATTFYGVFDLSDGSPSRKRFEEYRTEKAGTAKAETPSDARANAPEGSPNIMPNFHDTIDISTDTQKGEVSKTYSYELSLSTLEKYYALQSGFRNYVIEHQSSFQVVGDPKSLALADTGFVQAILPLVPGVNLDILKADSSTGKVLYDINQSRTAYLQTLGLSAGFLNGIQSISPLNIIKKSDGTYVVTDVGTNIKNLTPVLDELSIRDFQLGSQDIQYGKKATERTDENRKRIADNLDEEKTPEDRRKENMRAVLEEQGITDARQQDALIAVFLEVHNTANEIDENAEKLYNKNGVVVYKRSHKALASKMQKGLDGYDALPARMKKVIPEQQFRKLLKMMMREGLCANVVLQVLTNRNKQIIDSLNKVIEAKVSNGKQLRDLQIRALKTIVEKIQQNPKKFIGGYIDMFPGVGKTFLYGTILAALQQPSLLTVPPNLMEQTKNSLIKESGIDPGNILVLTTSNLGAVITTINNNSKLIVLSSGPTLLSLSKKNGELLKTLGHKIDLLITDEAHEIKGDQTGRVMGVLGGSAGNDRDMSSEALEELIQKHFDSNGIPKTHLLFTATPDNTKGKLSENYDEILSIPLHEGVSEGVVIQPTHKKVSVARFKSKDNQGHREFQSPNPKTGEMMPTRHALCNEIITTLDSKPIERKPTIGSCENIKQALDIKNYLRKTGQKNFHIISSHSGSSDRETAKKDLAEGRIDGVLVIGMYQGADFPFFRVGVNFYPSSSDQQNKQFFGRLIRTVEQDHIDNYYSHLKDHPKLKGPNLEKNLAALKQKSSENTIWIEPPYWNYPGEGDAVGKRIPNIMQQFYDQNYLRKPGSDGSATTIEIVTLTNDEKALIGELEKLNIYDQRSLIYYGGTKLRQKATILNLSTVILGRSKKLNQLSSGDVALLAEKLFAEDVSQKSIDKRKAQLNDLTPPIADRASLLAEPVVSGKTRITNKFASEVLGETTYQLSRSHLLAMADLLFPQEAKSPEVQLQEQIVGYQATLSSHGIIDICTLRQFGVHKFQSTAGLGITFARKVLRDSSMSHINESVLARIATELGLENIGQQTKEKYRQLLSDHNIIDQTALKITQISKLISWIGKNPFTQVNGHFGVPAKNNITQKDIELFAKNIGLPNHINLETILSGGISFTYLLGEYEKREFQRIYARDMIDAIQAIPIGNVNVVQQVAFIKVAVPEIYQVGVDKPGLYVNGIRAIRDSKLLLTDIEKEKQLRTLLGNGKLFQPNDPRLDEIVKSLIWTKFV